MDKLLSVIIPVYNVEAYLPECMDSLLSQSYQTLEVWLIDDGSTDHSGEICDAYAAKDDRVHVIHQQNGGAAAAKNAGLRAATGEYLTFLDSDDFLDPGSYEFMIYLLEEQEADVVQCAFRDVFVDCVCDRVFVDTAQVYTTEEYLLRFLTNWTSALACDKICKRRLFSNVFFEEGNKIDDEFFTYQGMMNAKKIVYHPRVVYNYRKRRSSVMLSPSSQEQIVIDRLSYLAKRRHNVVARFPQLQRKYEAHFAESLIILMRNDAISLTAAMKIQEAIRSLLSEKPKPKIPFQLKRLLKTFAKTDCENWVKDHPVLPNRQADNNRYFD